MVDVPSVTIISVRRHTLAQSLSFHPSSLFFSPLRPLHRPSTHSPLSTLSQSGPKPRPSYLISHFNITFTYPIQAPKTGKTEKSKKNTYIPPFPTLTPKLIPTVPFHSHLFPRLFVHCAVANVPGLRHVMDARVEGVRRRMSGSIEEIWMYMVIWIRGLNGFRKERGGMGEGEEYD